MIHPGLINHEPFAYRLSPVLSVVADMKFVFADHTVVVHDHGRQITDRADSLFILHVEGDGMRMLGDVVDPLRVPPGDRIVVNHASRAGIIALRGLGITRSSGPSLPWKVFSVFSPHLQFCNRSPAPATDIRQSSESHVAGLDRVDGHFVVTACDGLGITGIGRGLGRDLTVAEGGACRWIYHHMIGGAQARDEKNVKLGSIRSQAHLKSIPEIALPDTSARQQVNGDHSSGRIMKDLGVSTVER